MVGKDIYTNCGMVGLIEWPDGGGQVPDGGRMGARQRAGVARQRAGSRGMAQRGTI
jgi:hypothetical protein